MQLGGGGGRGARLEEGMQQGGGGIARRMPTCVCVCVHKCFVFVCKEDWRTGAGGLQSNSKGPSAHMLKAVLGAEGRGEEGLRAGGDGCSTPNPIRSPSAVTGYG